MNNIFSKLSDDIIIYLVKFLSNESEEKYWQDLYKKKFSKYVLPKINKGWKLVGINNYVICDNCIKSEFIDANCCNCNTSLPCANCYYYGTCIDYYCSTEFQLISWENIKGLLFDNIEYKNYEDFCLKKNKE